MSLTSDSAPAPENRVAQQSLLLEAVDLEVQRGDRRLFSGLNFSVSSGTLLHIEGRNERIKTLGWCTGGAQSYIEHAIERGLDAFISGEISEQTVYSARESGVHYYAAGHHATERFGVQALGERLAAELNIEHCYIELDNPV